MREALNILGFGPCHHMYEVIEKPEQKQRWRGLAAGGPADWEHLFEGYGACVDWPSAHYWRDLVAAYPEARVILTWRSPESWWQSFARTILKSLTGPGDPASLGRALVAEQVFGGRMDDRAHAIAVYQANVAAVLAEVPPGRLLVHRLGDGWAPLCAHLGVPVPDVPYPHSNTSDVFNARQAKR
jgi:hypothetical protein